MYNCPAGQCDIAWSGTDFYVYGTICGSAPGTNLPGIMKRAMDGTLTHIAGKYQGSTAENVAATMASFYSAGDLAIDGSGNIVFSDGNRIRRISGGMVTTIGGTSQTMTGNGGDYGPATSAQFYNPGGFAFYGGHTYVADMNNSCVRVIW
jgi:serine/threonine-protein kinase